MIKYEVQFMIEGTTMADGDKLSEYAIIETIRFYLDLMGNPDSRNELDCKVSNIVIKEV